jgi:hypothetical protein
LTADDVDELADEGSIILRVELDLGVVLFNGARAGSVGGSMTLLGLPIASALFPRPELVAAERRTALS